MGSTAIKMVLTEGEKLLWKAHTPTAPGQEVVAQNLINKALAQLNLGQNQISGVVTTGYSKKLFEGATAYMDEITANAAGIFKLSVGQARVIINIGGQDLKILHLGENGRVIDFKMNDKCAAGTGRFFEQAARILDTPLTEFGSLSADSDTELELNSTCVVFAESEIVSLLARGVRREDIIRSLNLSVARRVAGLMGRTTPQGAVFLDGGPAQNKGLVQALEDELLTEIKVLEEPQFTVAYGAALQGQRPS